MNPKAYGPFYAQPSWDASNEAVRWQSPRPSIGYRDGNGRARILVIDDDFASIPSLLSLLHEDGFWVDIMSHLNFTVVAQEMFVDYQAVIVDVKTPNSTGFDLLRDIRNNTQLPVLVLTALSGHEDRIAGLELGADDYVAKPCRPREVLARIHAILRRRRAS
jgi:two-component system response regulator CpxR